MWEDCDSCNDITPLTRDIGLPIYDAAIKRVLEYNKDSLCLNFAFISDTHHRLDSLFTREGRNNLQLFSICCSEEYIDFGVHGGDILTDDGYTSEGKLAMMDYNMRIMGEYSKPVFFVKGNHDKIDNWQFASITQNHIPKECKNDSLVPGCLYLDYETKKIRIIVLNNYPSNSANEKRIKTWLTNSALDFTNKDTPDDWECVVFIHINSRFSKALSDFQSGSGSFNGQPSGRLIACIHGHTHEDAYSNSEGYNYVGVTRGFSNEKEINTKKEFKFDIFSVDKRNKRLYETRVGEGRDRNYSYGLLNELMSSYPDNPYKLTYYVDGKEFKVDVIACQQPVTPEKAPMKEGYTFSGWSEVPDTMPAKDVTVTGTFDVNKYQITYIIDNDVVVTDSVEYGSTIVPPTVKEKEGYSFSGWDGIPETMPAKDVTVLGTFNENNYYITYIVVTIFLLLILWIMTQRKYRRL